MKLRRVLTTADAAWLVAGNMVGAGIFVTPGLVAAQLPSPAWILLAWLLGGVISLAGAAIYAELGTRLPDAGGDYQYLNAAFGPLWGFLTGWTAFILTFSASAAAMAIASMTYLAKAVPALQGLTHGATAAGGALLILALTAANTAGARVAGRATAALTAVPVAGLLLLFAVGMLLGGGEEAGGGEELGRGEEAGRGPAVPEALPSPGLALGAALLPIFFTYSGWNAAAYVAGEIRNPARSLPRALLVGTGLVTILYVVFNAGLLWILPREILSGSTSAGTQAAKTLLGPGAERTLSALIAVAIVGSANVTLMAGARVYYAMASNSLAPRFLSGINRHGVPANALWAGGVWSALLAATGTFSRLLAWATLALLLLSALAVCAIFVLRARRADEAPYKCPGYPFTPIAYLAAALLVLGASAVAEPKEALIGMLLVAAGLPAYALVRRVMRRA